MHEMSLVTNILAIAEQQARQEGARSINRIELEVGALAGVENHALEFCFQTAKTGTLAQEAALIIHTIPGEGWCASCQEKVFLDFLVGVCPTCGTSLVEVVRGRELRVKSINVD